MFPVIIISAFTSWDIDTNMSPSSDLIKRKQKKIVLLCEYSRPTQHEHVCSLGTPDDGALRAYDKSRRNYVLKYRVLEVLWA